MTLLGNLFENVEAKTRAAWDAAKRSRSFAPGDQLFAIEEMPQVVYEMRSGSAKLWRPSRNGQALTLFHAGPGYVPGLIPVCRHARTMAYATATSPIDAYAVPASTMLKLFEQDSRLAANAFNIATNMLYVLADRLDDMSSARIEQKISRALLRLACEHGSWNDDEARLDITRQDLADLTGTTHYTASRVLSEWDRQGIVVSGRGYVTIKDDAALGAIAEL